MVDGGCWLWLAATDQEGYPVARLCGRVLRVHRVMATLIYDQIDGLDVHHTCGKRGCVNPDHLVAIDPESHRELSWLKWKGGAVSRIPF